MGSVVRAAGRMDCHTRYGSVSARREKKGSGKVRAVIEQKRELEACKYNNNHCSQEECLTSPVVSKLLRLDCTLCSCFPPKTTSSVGAAFQRLSLSVARKVDPHNKVELFFGYQPTGTPPYYAGLTLCDFFSRAIQLLLKLYD